MLCRPFTYSIDIYSETFSLGGLCHFIRVGLLYLVLGEIFVHCHISLFLVCFIQPMRKEKKKMENK